MSRPHSFGGSWTADKLDRLRGYLQAYTTIFKNQPWATTVYVDAFAGTGTIATRSEPGNDVDETSLVQFVDGSARVALSIEPAFDQYLFIEQSATKVQRLRHLLTDLKEKADRVTIEKAEANSYLIDWIRRTDWRKTRAVVFLDPYGMQVEWRLLEAIAGTHAIDLWLLVPVGIGANRLMTRFDLPPEEWQDRLTRFFGNDEWKERFYRPTTQPDLFGQGPIQEKAANHEALAEYFAERLRSVFGADGVAPRPLTLRNSQNTPMFMLCFASANKTGLKIADWLLTNRPKRQGRG